MLSRVLFALALLVVCASTCQAQAVPSAISYQGKLTDSSGQPVPDGQRTIILKLYSTETGGSPVWTSASLPVTTVGGVFTTSFSPTSSVLSAGSLWIETAVGGSALAPRMQLQSVPFAVRAASSDSVPDGSISKAKLATDLAFVHDPNRLAITSGLPSNLSVQIKIDGVLQTGARLAAPYVEDLNVGWGSVVLRRAVTTDRTWANWAKSVLADLRPTNPDLHHSAQTDLTDGSTHPTMTWAFTDGFASDYALILADDGLPVEELSLDFRNLVVRTSHFGAGTASAPIGCGMQTELASGQPAGTKYTVTAGTTTFSDCLIASTIAFGSGINYTGGTGGIPRSKLPGGAPPCHVTLVQNPSARGGLYEWYYGWSRLTNMPKKSISVLLTPAGQASQTLIQGTDAYPNYYRLELADDGLPIEMFALTYTTTTAP